MIKGQDNLRRFLFKINVSIERKIFSAVSIKMP